MMSCGEHGEAEQFCGSLITTTHTVYASPGLNESVWAEYDSPLAVRTSLASAPVPTSERCTFPDCMCQRIGSRCTSAAAAVAAPATSSVPAASAPARALPVFILTPLLMCRSWYGLWSVSLLYLRLGRLRGDRR